MDREPTTWPSPDGSFEERQAWAETVPFEERLRCAAKHALPRSDDDTPILVGSGGRRASPEELLEFTAHEQERIARGGDRGVITRMRARRRSG